MQNDPANESIIGPQPGGGSNSVYRDIGILQAQVAYLDQERKDLRAEVIALRAAGVQRDEHLRIQDENMAKLGDAIAKREEADAALTRAKEAELAEHRKSKQAINERVWAILAAVVLGVGQRSLSLLPLPHPYEFAVSFIFAGALVLLIIWLLLQRPRK